jgi:hypothetical protein
MEKLEPALKQNEKHMNIESAIERLESVNRQLMNFQNKITGCDSPPSTDTVGPTPTPNLIDILNQGGNRIAEISEQISEKIVELDSLLF